MKNSSNLSILVPRSPILLDSLVPQEHGSRKEKNAHDRCEECEAVPLFPSEEKGGGVDADECEWQNPG